MRRMLTEKEIKRIVPASLTEYYYDGGYEAATGVLSEGNTVIDFGLGIGTGYLYVLVLEDYENGNDSTFVVELSGGTECSYVAGMMNQQGKNIPVAVYLDSGACEVRTINSGDKFTPTEYYLHIYRGAYCDY